MSAVQLFAQTILRIANFIDKWFYYFVSVAVVTFAYNYFFVKDWEKLLFIACRDGKLKEVENILQQKPNVNCQIEQEKTPLIAACLGNHKDIAIKLLATGQCKMNVQDSLGATAIFTACRLGHIDLVRLLLSRSADMTVPNNDGTSPLIIACMEGHEAIVALLLEKGADVKFKNKYGLNALNAAISSHDQPNGRLNIIKRLLTIKQINLESKTAAGWTALMKSSFKGYEDVVKLLLLNPQIDVNASAENGFTALIGASQNGWFGVVKLLIQRGANIDAQLYDGSTALIAACYGGYTDIVEYLTSLEAHHSHADRRRNTVNHTYKQGSTALMAAAYKGYVDVAATLVANGCEVNAVNEEGWSALTVSAEKGYYQITCLLLQHKADPNLVNKAGFAPIMYAAKLGYTDIVEELIAHGALVNHVTFDADDTPKAVDVTNAVDYDINNYDVSSDNINSNISIIGSSNSTGVSGSDGIAMAKTVTFSDVVASSTISVPPPVSVHPFTLIDGYMPPLMLAISTNKIDMVKLLIKNKADVNISMAKVAPIITKRDLSFANKILNEVESSSNTRSSGVVTSSKSPTNADSSEAGTKKESPRFKKGGRKATSKDIEAQELRELQHIEAIIDELKEINSIYHYFSTPLLYAVFLENLNIIKLLIDSGADIEGQNGSGDTAIVLAAYIGNIPIVQYLLNKKVEVPSLWDDYGKTASSIVYHLTKKCKFGALVSFSVRYLSGAAFTRSSSSGSGGSDKVKTD